MSFLASTVAAPRSGSFSSLTTYRKYGSVISTSCQVGGVTDTSHKRVLYEVGVRHKSVKAALAPHPEDVPVGNATFSTVNCTSELFNGLARKFSNFSGRFDAANLAGVVMRVARALACDSAYPAGVTGEDILGGRPLRVHGLGTYFSPVSANAETVFIPRVVDSVLAPDTFSVLCHAVCGEGGIVATDAVEVNPQTRAPVIPDVDSYAVAAACVDALRILGSNFAACGQGELFALSVTKGLCDVLTVVGHTDEGGIMRDILRGCAVGVPFGGIHVGLPDYVGLPALATSEGAVVGGYCDALLLNAAAAVAHCDPGITYNGMWLPTVLTASSPSAGYHAAGVDVKPAQWMAEVNRTSLRRVFEPFARNYTAALAKVFGLPAEGGPAAALLTSGVNALGKDERHLRFPVIAPFFWIEPTSILPADAFGTVAEAQGFASIVTRHQYRDLPLWENATVVGRSAEHATNMAIQFRSARTCGYLTHFWGHENDGVAFVTIRQLDPEGILLPGPVRDGTVAATVSNGCSLGDLLWKRGQSPLPAPAECLNIAQTMGVRVSHFGIDDEGYPTPFHTPSAAEIASGFVTVTATGLTGLKEGPLTEKPREARRARSRAGHALGAAVAGMARYGTTSCDDMPLLLSAPSIGRPPAITLVRAVGVDEGSGRAHVVAAKAAHSRDVIEPNEGVPLKAVMANSPDAGPRTATSNRVPNIVAGPNDPATVRSVNDAVSETSATGPAPAPMMSTTASTSAAPLERADNA